MTIPITGEEIENETKTFKTQLVLKKSSLILRIGYKNEDKQS